MIYIIIYLFLFKSNLFLIILQSNYIYKFRIIKYFKNIFTEKIMK